MQPMRIVGRLAFAAAILTMIAAPARGAERAARKQANSAANASKREVFSLTDPNVVQRQETYKKVGDLALKIDIFEPKHKDPAREYPAIVFFFGSGWVDHWPCRRQ